MITLFIDSSRKSLSVALASKSKLLFVSNVNSYSKHSNFLMKEIKTILDKCNMTIYDVDNIVVLNGPGSFTGVRVGVTLAKTIAWSLSKKLYQLTTLEALGACVADDVIISVFPDKDDASYVGIYDSSYKVLEYLSIDSEKLKITGKNITIVCMEDNPFTSELVRRLSVNNNVKIEKIKDYDYLKVIDFAMEKGSINPHLIEPVYLKKIDAEKKIEN